MPGKRFTRFHHYFALWSQKASVTAGSPDAFILAVGTIVIWAAMGLIFNFSDSWQMVLNTITASVTFLLVFLIQNSQNRETRAIQLKLDELIRSHKDAENSMLRLEKLTDEELAELCMQYEKLAEEAKQRREKHVNLISEINQ